MKLTNTGQAERERQSSRSRSGLCVLSLRKKKKNTRKKELTNVKVTSSEPSSHRFTSEALTLVKNGDTRTRMWRNTERKNTQFSSSSSVRAAVLFPRPRLASSLFEVCGNTRCENSTSCLALARSP